MNNLKTFYQKNMNEVLNVPKQREVKGGIRYFTNNFADYQKKQQELNLKGIYFNTDENDGVFSVEW